MIANKSIQVAQTQANLLAVLAHYELPPLVVLTSQVDRITAAASPEFTARLTELAIRGDFRAWNFVRNHGTTAIRGWRENCQRCSVQIIEHAGSIYEMDVDLWNPDYGVLPALQHTFMEVWKPGKTDAAAVRKGLFKRGILVEEITA